MAKTLTSSQLTFVDISDTRKLSIYLASNLQTIQMRTQTGAEQYTYTPDWSNNATNLKISLQAFLDQKLLSEQDPSAASKGRLQISWYKKDGNGAEEQIKDASNNAFTGETLTITTNALQNTVSKMLTYICRVKYTDVDTNIESEVENQLTYTLMDTAKNAKSCSIRGEQVFKYDINNKVSPASIELTAVVQNIGSNVEYTWQYWDATSSTWADYPSATHSSTLNIKPDDTVFFNDILKIKMSPDGDIYDIITIAKVYDGKTGSPGAAGASAYTILLTNESYSFPGTTHTAKENAVDTKVLAYQGTAEKTATIKTVDGKNPSSTKTATDTEGLSFLVNGSVITFYSSDKLTAATGTIPIVVTVDNVDYTKVFSWSVSYTGAGACSLSIETSSQIFKSTDGVNYTPNTVTLTPVVQNLTLSDDTSWKYSTDGGNSWPDVKDTINNGTNNVYYDTVTKALTIPNNFAGYTGAVTSIVFKCVHKINDDEEYTDSVTIAKLSDGQSASAAYTVILSNEVQNIATNNNLIPLEPQPFKCAVMVYAGSTQLTAVGEDDVVEEGYFKVVLPETSPNGITLSQATAGEVTFAVGSTAIAASGTIDLAIQVEAETNVIIKSISYSAAKSGGDGVSPVIFQIISPNGTVFTNQSGQLRLHAIAYEGADEITDGATYQWAAYDPNNPDDLNGDGYKDIDGATNSYYDALGEKVVNIQTYRCVMIYNNKPYTAIITLEDKSDTYVSEMLTIGGTTFKNGQGGSVVYVVVRANGVEKDPFPENCALVNKPSDPKNGDYWWEIDKGVAKLRQYNGTNWEDATDPQLFDYNWSLMDKDGNAATFEKTGKVIYLSCADINSIGTLQCDVTTK